MQVWWFVSWYCDSLSALVSYWLVGIFGRQNCGVYGHTDILCVLICLRSACTVQLRQQRLEAEEAGSAGSRDRDSGSGNGSKIISRSGSGDGQGEAEESNSSERMSGSSGLVSSDSTAGTAATEQHHTADQTILMLQTDSKSRVGED